MISGVTRVRVTGPDSIFDSLDGDFVRVSELERLLGPDVDLLQLKETSDAWYTVCTTLDCVLPGWMGLDRTGIRSAVAAINALATVSGIKKAQVRYKRGARVRFLQDPHNVGIVIFHAPNGDVWVKNAYGHEVCWKQQYVSYQNDDDSATDTCITAMNGDCINPACKLHSE